MKQIRRFFQFFYSQHGKLVIVYILLTLLHKLISFLTPQATQWLVDAAVERNISRFGFVAVLAIGLTLLFILVLYLRSLCADTAENHAVSIEKKRILGDMLRVPFLKLKGNPAGHYLHFMERDVERVKGLAFYDITVFISNVVMTIAMLFYLFICDWLLSLVVLCTLPLFVLASKIMLPRVEKATEDVTNQAEKVNDLVNEFYTGNESIRTANAQEFFMKRVEKEISKWQALKLYLIRNDITYDVFLVTGLMNVANITIYCLGGWRAISGVISIGTITTFALYFSSLWNCIEGFMGFLKQYRIKRVSLRRLSAFHDLVLQVDDMRNEGDLPVFTKLEMKNVCFAYGEKQVLKNFSLEIHRGEKVLLSGDNGSGKSTLARLIVGLITPNTGDIYYNGINCRHIALDSLRKHMLLVPSEPFIIEGDAKDNLWGNASEAVLPSFLANIKIQNNGENLSTGQKKQLQLYRYLAANADVYILDEPFNYVDNDAKQQLWEVIREVFVGKTLIVISHDPYPTKDCDRTIRI